MMRFLSAFAALLVVVSGVGYAGTLGVAVGFLILFGIGWGFFDTNNMPILSQIWKAFPSSATSASKTSASRTPRCLSKQRTPTPPRCSTA